MVKYIVSFKIKVGIGFIIIVEKIVFITSHVTNLGIEGDKL